MDAATKKRIEEQLRQLVRQAENGQSGREETEAPASKRPTVVRVIRRRKGIPDRKVA